MMHHKGLLFAPESEITHSLLTDSDLSPRTVKQLGRQVPNFDEKVWNANRFKIVVEGNYYKFTQNDKLKRRLLETGQRELVEASPRDRIWGVGFGEKNAGRNRSKWGLNLLGKALMEVRERIRREESERQEDEEEEEEESME